jgi:hypothetical protein
MTKRKPQTKTVKVAVSHKTMRIKTPHTVKYETVRIKAPYSVTKPKNQ